MNTKVLFTTKANSLSGMFGNKNGDILVGDKAFEFYNNRNPEDYIQIPWSEIVRVRAQIFFKDNYIRGFFIDTKSAGSYNFVVKNAFELNAYKNLFVYSYIPSSLKSSQEYYVELQWSGGGSGNFKELILVQKKQNKLTLTPKNPDETFLFRQESSLFQEIKQ